MVIGPEELEARIVETEREKIARVEENIDIMLQEKYRGTGSILISAGVFEGVRSFVRDGLLDKYRAAGWVIKYSACGFNGSSDYSFKPLDAEDYYRK